MYPNLLSFVHEAYSIVKQQLPKYSSKYSRKDFTLHQLVVLNLIRIRHEFEYREAVDLVGYMTPIRDTLELDDMPHFTTVQKAMDRVNAWKVRWILKESARRMNPSGRAAMDATGFDRHWSSRHYTQCAQNSIDSLKVSVLVDVEDGNGPILDVHMTTQKTHDTQIPPTLCRGHWDQLESVAADKGYDHRDIREWMRGEHVRPLIRHRSQRHQGPAANARMNDDDYHRRSLSETAFSVMKREYGETVRSRTWYRQFREMIMTAAVYNIDRRIKNDSLFIRMRFCFQRAA
jgi:IS5 family transposase